MPSSVACQNMHSTQTKVFKVTQTRGGREEDLEQTGSPKCDGYDAMLPKKGLGTLVFKKCIFLPK
jgi:hypothetical protein